MKESDFTDETLMRYADGELDPDAAAELERAMETDDALVARVALFVETRTLAQTALKPLLNEPVPAALAKSVEKMVAQKNAADEFAANVLPFRRSGGNRAAGRWALPIAASLAAIVGGFGGYWLAGIGGPALPDLHVAGISSQPLGDALATVASGMEAKLAEPNQRFRAIATFRDNAQALCREFEVDSADRTTVVAVACHSGREWRVRFAVVAPGNESGYAPASSTEALDAYLAAIDAKAPMEAEEEIQALNAIREQSQN